MALHSIVLDTKTVIIAGQEVTAKPLVLGQLLRLIKLLDTIKADMGLSREDLENVEWTKAQAFLGVASRVVKIVVASVDLEADEPKLAGVGELIARELGRLVGLDPQLFLEAHPEEITNLLLAVWEVNSSGPLGQYLGDTIAYWTPTLTALRESLLSNYLEELTTDPRIGGARSGGTTPFSIPSTPATDGPSTTSTPSSPSGASSPDATAPSSSPDTRTPSDAPTQGPQEALAVQEATAAP